MGTFKMNSAVKNACIIFALISCTSTFAQTPAAEQLLVTPPDHFVLGADHSRDKNTYMEYVLSGQSVDNWTDMLTVQIYKGASITPAAFLQKIGGGIVGKCPGTVSKHNIINGTSNGYVVSMLDLWCPNNPQTNKPETIIFRVIKGADALYSVQYAWRSTPTAEQIDAAVKYLAQASVCDSRSEQHSCPALSPVKSLSQ
jgi:hypothetical protein